jgi:hypothetical protein
MICSQSYLLTYLTGVLPDGGSVVGDLNLSVLSVRPRVSELKRTGKIKQTGARRKNESGMTATVWRIAS